MERISLQEFKIEGVSVGMSWNDLVLSSNNYSFLQSWQQGEIALAQGYRVHRYVITAGDLPVLIFQVNFVGAKRGKIAQLRHGPLLTKHFHSRNKRVQVEVLSFFKQQLRILAKAVGMDYIRVQSLEPEVTSAIGGISAQIHNIDAQKTLVLDISKPNENLLQSMRKQTRYNINKASKIGVTIREESTPEGVAKFYEIHKDTTVRQKFISYDLDYYQKAFSCYNAGGSELRSHVLLADYEGKTIAGAIIITFGQKAFYSDGGSLTEFAKIPASYAIQWHAINLAKAAGAVSYNFWGGVSPDKNDTSYPWYGIDLFKRGFGGERVEYMHPRDIPLSPRYALVWLWELIEKTRRGY